MNTPFRFRLTLLLAVASLLLAVPATAHHSDDPAVYHADASPACADVVTIVEEAYDADAITKATAEVRFSVVLSEPACVEKFTYRGFVADEEPGAGEPWSIRGSAEHLETADPKKLSFVLSDVPYDDGDVWVWAEVRRIGGQEKLIDRAPDTGGLCLRAEDQLGISMGEIKTSVGDCEGGAQKMG